MSSKYNYSILSPSGNSNDGVTPNPGVFYNGSLALAAAMTTVPVPLKDIDQWSLSFSTPAGSTLVGSIAIQVSNDQSRNETSMASDVELANWQTISFWDLGAGAQAASKAVASGAQTLLIGDRYSLYRWMRLQFTFTSGTGLAKISLQQKGQF